MLNGSGGDSGGRPSERIVSAVSACFAVSTMLATFALPLGAQRRDFPTRPPGDPAAIERGRALYSVNCTFCHGADTRGGDGGPSLLRAALVLDDQQGELIAPVVKGGRPDRGMPRFNFTDD